MIAFIENDVITKYNASLGDVLKKYPNTSFCLPLEDQDLENDFGIVTVKDAPYPEHNSDTHSVQEITPTLVDGVWQRTYRLKEHTQEEKDERLESKKFSMRSRRNSHLTDSDWTQLPDASVDTAAWATYRQALRDLPTQEGFPLNITWPTKP